MSLPTLDALKKKLALTFELPHLEKLENESKFLYYLLTKISISSKLINHSEWQWLEIYIPDLAEVLQRKEKSDRDQLEALAYDLFKQTYTKYSFLFQSTPVEFLGFKHFVNADYAHKVIVGLLASILLKLDGGYELSEDEILHLKANRLDEQKFNKLSRFLDLKKKYKTLSYPGVNPSDRLYSILQKLESSILLTPKDIDFLRYHKLYEVIKVYEKNFENDRQAFITLKMKYNIQDYEDTSPTNLLYQILQKFESAQYLEDLEINWLKSQNLQTVIDLDQLFRLKFKYGASEYPEISIHSHLYKILSKIDQGLPLSDSDLNFLRKRQLFETINFAFDRYCQILIQQLSRGEPLTEFQQNWIQIHNKYEILAQGKIGHFQTLITQYEICKSSKTTSSFDQNLYLILGKLDQGIRLDAIDLAYLKDNHLFEQGTKLYITYHRLEAQFDEQDYAIHKNPWKIPSISSNWRKAEEPKNALNATQFVNIESLKEKKLQAAILTTQGGAYRDIEELNTAEKCAKRAIALQPSSHHPYTLMGAICYDRHDCSEGDRWFAQAIERGASSQAIDREIEKAINRTKDQKLRQKMIKYLLRQDPVRYEWVQKYQNSYSKKQFS